MTWTPLLAVLLTAAPPGTAPLRVVSYNVAALSQGADLVVRELRRLRPDLVALQEVDQGTRRSGGVDQAEWLGRQTGMHAVFGAAMDHDGGRYGLALLSREPLHHPRTDTLPRLADEEPRIMLWAETTLRGRAALVFTTHLSGDWHTRQPERVRAAQAAVVGRLIRQRRAAFAGPLLGGGDFNCEPGSPPWQALKTGWTRLSGGHRTYPSHAPARSLDHVLWAGPLPARHQSRVGDGAGSDHLPVVVDLWWDLP